MAEVIAETGIEPSELCLEVTESVLIEDPESSIKTLTRLKELGVKIAIDDFGTGYSSLEYLRRLPVDCVKVDRSFVRGVPDNEEDVAIVNAVIELGHALKLSVTAEGVETAEQLGRSPERWLRHRAGFPVLPARAARGGRAAVRRCFGFGSGFGFGVAFGFDFGFGLGFE